MTLRISCKQGGEAVYILPSDENRDPHSRLDAAGCSHCTEDGNADSDHHCGMNGNLCSKEHAGDCWNPGPGEPRVEERPDGCSVCRPLTIELIPGGAQVTGAA